MNFIRLVKTPRLDLPSQKKPLKKKSSLANVPHISFIFTLTTDFSTFASNAEVSCQLVSTSEHAEAHEQVVQWHDTDREVKVEIPLSTQFKQGMLILRPCTSTLLVGEPEEFLTRYLGTKSSHIVSLQTHSFNISHLERQDTVHRTFSLPSGELICIAEQTGETIIRHIWDAGIILSALLVYSSLPSLPSELRTFVSDTCPLNKTFRVLELGAGVGILGISLATMFPQAEVILTDLLDAGVLITENICINTNRFPHLASRVQFRELDWEKRPFPRWTEEEHFDVIVMADVTYNTATFVPLADTLVQLLRGGSKGAKVICCGKRRHAEEMGFWRIVKERGITLDKSLAYALDLEGKFTTYKEGEAHTRQVVDFICMSLS